MRRSRSISRSMASAHDRASGPVVTFAAWCAYRSCSGTKCARNVSKVSITCSYSLRMIRRMSALADGLAVSLNRTPRGAATPVHWAKPSPWRTATPIRDHHAPFSSLQGMIRRLRQVRSMDRSILHSNLPSGVGRPTIGGFGMAASKSAPFRMGWSFISNSVWAGASPRANRSAGFSHRSIGHSARARRWIRGDPVALRETGTMGVPLDRSASSSSSGPRSGRK